MSKLIDLTGKRFGRLKVVERNANIGTQTAWLCKCECGNKTTVTGYKLRIGHTTSCGCRRKEVPLVHGKRRQRIYNIWNAILQRCNNPNNTKYEYYGGRGITVCAEWNEFIAFDKWATECGYTDDMQIDRIDSNGGYTPENCRWVSHKANQNNKRNNIMITYDGETHTIAEWGELTGIKPNTILWRYRAGKEPSEILKNKK